MNLKRDNFTSYSHDNNITVNLRNYMNGVYLIMATGLIITALAAFAINSVATTNDVAQAVGTFKGTMLTNLGVSLYLSNFRYVIMFAPLAMVLFLSFSINSISASAARALFVVYSGVMGLSLSSIFMVYTQTSIVQVFFITSAAFASLSLYGYTTKKDLSAFGTFLFLALIGIIIAMLVNAFLVKSAGLNLAISVAGVLVFAGLTAYNTQRIKSLYFELDDSETVTKKMTLGALTLYIDFINMFLFLLQLLGTKRD